MGPLYSQGRHSLPVHYGSDQKPSFPPVSPGLGPGESSSSIPQNNISRLFPLSHCTVFPINRSCAGELTGSPLPPPPSPHLALLWIYHLLRKYGRSWWSPVLKPCRWPEYWGLYTPRYRLLKTGCPPASLALLCLGAESRSPPIALSRPL